MAFTRLSFTLHYIIRKFYYHHQHSYLNIIIVVLQLNKLADPIIAAPYFGVTLSNISSSKWTICSFKILCLMKFLKKCRQIVIKILTNGLYFLGLLGPAVCLLAITVSGCRPYLIVFLITLGIGLGSFVLSGFNVTHVDMSPTFAGTLYAITNTAASTTGFIGPSIVGYFTEKGVSNF